MRTPECQNAILAAPAPVRGAKGGASVSFPAHAQNAPAVATERTVIAIDPGTEESALVVYRGGAVVWHTLAPNSEVEEYLRDHPHARDCLAIEWLGSYGMPVGQSVFHTCRWVGRFEAAWGRPVHLMERRNVKMHLCNSVKATDANVWQAVMDRYGSEKARAVGTKKSPGPLYGIHKDTRQALALAVAWCELRGQEVTR